VETEFREIIERENRETRLRKRKKIVTLKTEKDRERLRSVCVRERERKGAVLLKTEREGEGGRGYRGQFHQHFTCTFFIRKCFRQLFSRHSLALKNFGAKISAQKLLVKYDEIDYRSRKFD